MRTIDREFAYAVFRRFIDAVSAVDCSTLQTIATSDVHVEVPGTRSAYITNDGTGLDALCAWTRRVYMECGKLEFEPHRLFDNGNELMTAGIITIEHHPHTFKSLCLTYVCFEDGKIAKFQLLLDTFALQKFHGEAD
jgi:hypothetical protein